MRAKDQIQHELDHEVIGLDDRINKIEKKLKNAGQSQVIVNQGGGGGGGESGTETDPIWTAQKPNYYTKTQVDQKIDDISIEETDPIATGLIGTMSTLLTTAKNTLVAAINELCNKFSSYYTSSQTDILLGGKSATTHNHNLNDLTEKSYDSLTNKPDLLSLTNNVLKTSIPTKVIIPSDFDVLPVDVSVIDYGYGRFTISPTISEVLNVTGTPKTYYVNPVTGSDSNSGLTAALPLLKISTALAKADVDIVSLAAGVYQSLQYGFTSLPDRDIQMVCPTGVAVVGVSFSGSSRTWTDMTGYFRNSATTSVRGVYDTSVPEGDTYKTYTQMTSEAEVAATEFSWWKDSGTNLLYVNTGTGGSAPGLSHLFFYQTLSINSSAFTGPRKFYFENIKFLGGCAWTESNGSKPITLLAKNTYFLSTPLTNGISIIGNVFTYFDSCVAALNTLDGFNYHSSGVYAPTGIEFGCVGYGNGVGTTANLNNGSTIHEDARIIRVRSVAYNNKGSNFHDANTSKSYNIGCIGYASTSTDDRYDRDFATSQTAEMWLYKCSAPAGSAHGATAEGTSEIHRFETTIIGEEDTTYNDGTINEYVPTLTDTDWSNIPTLPVLQSADDNFVTDAEKVVIGNTSGVNTGDDTLADLGGVALDQTTPQTIINGSPIFDEGITTNKIIRNGAGATIEVLTGRESSFDLIYTSATDGGAVTDITTAMASTTETGSTLLPISAHRVYIGSDAPFTTIGMYLTTMAVGLTLVVEYWNGSAWTAVSNLVDGTSNFTKVGTITYDTPAGWATSAVNSQTKYWLKLRSTTSSSPDGIAQLILPTAYTANNLFELIPNALDTSAMGGLSVNNMGKVKLPFIDGALSVSGALSSDGAIAAGATLTAASYVTGLYCRGANSPLYVPTDGLYCLASVVATGVTGASIPSSLSPRLRFTNTAWDIDGGAAVNQHYYNDVESYAGNTVTSKLRWNYVNGVMATADEYQGAEIMNIFKNQLNSLGNSYGAECLTNGALTSGTSWSADGYGWTLSGNVATYVRSASGAGRLIQANADLATPIKGNRWYRFTYTTSGQNTTVHAYIDPDGISQERVYLRGVSVATAGTWTVTFKTKETPGDFIISAYGAAASDQCVFDDFSLVEITSGDVVANGNFTGGGSAGIKVDEIGRVAIGGTPNANAILDVQSTTKAFMPPRMTTTERDAIPTPTEGMVIYNLTTHNLDFYNGSAWGAV